MPSQWHQPWNPAGRLEIPYPSRRERLVKVMELHAAEHRTYEGRADECRNARDGFQHFPRTEACGVAGCTYSGVRHHAHCRADDCVCATHATEGCLRHRDQCPTNERRRKRGMQTLVDDVAREAKRIAGEADRRPPPVLVPEFPRAADRNEAAAAAALRAAAAFQPHLGVGLQSMASVTPHGRHNLARATHAREAAPRARLELWTFVELRRTTGVRRLYGVITGPAPRREDAMSALVLHPIWCEAHGQGRDEYTAEAPQLGIEKQHRSVRYRECLAVGRTLLRPVDGPPCPVASQHYIEVPLRQGPVPTGDTVPQLLQTRLESCTSAGEASEEDRRKAEAILVAVTVDAGVFRWTYPRHSPQLRSHSRTRVRRVETLLEMQQRENEKRKAIQTAHGRAQPPVTGRRPGRRLCSARACVLHSCCCCTAFTLSRSILAGEAAGTPMGARRFLRGATPLRGASTTKRAA